MSQNSPLTPRQICGEDPIEERPLVRDPENIYQRPHELVTHPRQWLEEHPEIWASCFRKKDTLGKLVIGCADPRVNGRNTMGWAGLGINEGLSVAARRVTALLEDTYRECDLVLESHDGCAAALNSLRRKRLEDTTDVATHAADWGKELANKVMELTGRWVEHKHVATREMKPPQTFEVIYVDCTDHFTAVDKGMPFGHRASMMSPGGLRFATHVMLRNIVTNGLGNHMQQLDLLANHVTNTTTPEGKSLYKRPLAFIVIRDEAAPTLSDIAQSLAENIAGKYGPSTKVIPIDEAGNLHHTDFGAPLSRHMT